MRTEFNFSKQVREITARMTEADSTDSVDLFIIPKNSRLLGISVNTIDEMAAITLSVGDSGTANLYLDAESVATAGLVQYDVLAATFSEDTTVTGVFSGVAGTGIIDISFVFSLEKDTSF